MLGVNAREAVRSLAASKQRTLLALVGIIIGIGSVMAMLGVGETVKAEALRRFQQMGTDVVTLRPGWGGRDQGGERQALHAEDLELLARYARSVRGVSPEVENYGKVQAGPAENSVTVKGVWPSFLRINRLEMGRGRFFTPYDESRSFVVLGHEAQRNLVAKGAPQPLTDVNIEGRPYTVIGVLAPTQGASMGPMTGESVLVPLDMAQRWSREPGVSQATVWLWPEADHDAASAEIIELMGRFRGGPARLDIHSPRQLLEQIAGQMRLYTLLLAAVGSISLIVGGVGIMNMMLVSVTERRREIGIRRALGAQQRDIVSQFLVESMLLSLVGGVVGVGLGTAASLIIARLQDWEPMVLPSAMALCLGVSLAVGLFFGYYPARKAAGVDVIVALKAD
jgi:putative ABC transport system permease protein